MSVLIKSRKFAYYALQGAEALVSDKSSVCVAGWIASGSTFIYQVLSDLGAAVRKVHGYPKFSGGAFVVYTIRDPRDIAVSTARRQFRELLDSEGKEEALRAAVDLLSRQRMLEDLKLCLQASDRLIIRYESFFGGMEDLLVRSIADQICIDVGNEKVLDVVNANSIDANRKRMEALGGFSNFDSKNLIHGNHISTGGKVGVWKDEFTESVEKYFHKKLPGLLEAAGYRD